MKLRFYHIQLMHSQNLFIQVIKQLFNTFLLQTFYKQTDIPFWMDGSYQSMNRPFIFYDSKNKDMKKKTYFIWIDTLVKFDLYLYYKYKCITKVHYCNFNFGKKNSEFLQDIQNEATLWIIVISALRWNEGIVLLAYTILYIHISIHLPTFWEILQ